MCVEVLGIMIRQNKMIKCITMQGTDIFFTQYTDDTELMLEGGRTSFEKAINTVQSLGERLDCIKTGKTSAIWLD